MASRPSPDTRLAVAGDQERKSTLEPRREVEVWVVARLLMTLSLRCKLMM
jgi:hypothetical protein